MTDQNKALAKSLQVIELLNKELGKFNEPIAIVGTGMKLPGDVDNMASLWSLLINEQSTTEEIPSSRWDVDKWYSEDADEAGKMYTRKASFIKNPAAFDKEFFRVSTEEASSMDPMHRLLLECSWQALEQANVTKSGLKKDSIGVFVGIGPHEYGGHDINSPNFTGYNTVGSHMSFSAGRISYYLGIQGPSMAIDTACSSSLSAIHSAVRSLRNDDCSLALAGGVNLLLTTDMFIKMSRLKALSPDGLCKTFSADADGYGRGEGCGVIALRRLSMAQKKQDKILGVIRATSLNHDGASSGLTVPNRLAQESLIKNALAEAKLKPGDIDYVECHGTGTDLGDPIEVQSLQNVFGSDRDKPLIIGAVKSNIGHLESAAGMASIFKVLACFDHGSIPKTLHCEQLSKKIDWDSYKVQVAQKAMPWGENNKPRRAGVSSFGMSGTNAHVILEEAPEVESQPDKRDNDRVLQARSYQLISISGEGSEALSGQLERLSNHLEDHPDQTLEQIAYSLATIRSHFRSRTAVIARDQKELVKKLSEPLDVVRPLPGKLAFLYTGGGAQYIDMGRELYETEEVFKETMDQCLHLIQKEAGEDFRPILFAKKGSEGAKKLDQIDYMLLSLFAIEYSLTKLWQSWGVEPDVLMGHSLGEIVAATVAGVLSLEDGIKLVTARGKLMASVKRLGRMATVETSIADLKPFLKQVDGVSVGGENGPKQTLISGAATGIEQISKLLEEADIKVKILPISQASHSPLMEEILPAFKKEAEQIEYNASNYPLVSNVSGKLAGAEIQTADYWTRHIRETVLFSSGMQTLEAEGVTTYLEIGPQASLIGMGAYCVSNSEDCQWLASIQQNSPNMLTMLESLGSLYRSGLNPDWKSFYKDREQAKVDLPTYCFHKKRYWIEAKNENLIQASDPLWKALESEDEQKVSDLLGGSLSPQNLVNYLKKEEHEKAANTLTYVTEWQEQAISASGNNIGKWLIVNSEPLVSEAFVNGLVNEIQSLGGEVEILKSEGITGQLDKVQASAISGVIRLWPATANDDIAMLPQQIEALTIAALEELQALENHDDLGLIWMTEGVHNAKLSASSLSLSPLWGLGKVAIMEGHGPSLKLVDLPSFTLSHQEAFGKLLLSLSSESLFRIDSERCFTPKLVRKENPMINSFPDLSRGTVLITGGLGHIGLKTARWLGSHGAGHLLLVGRSDCSEYHRNEIASLPVKVSTAVCDISDPAALSDLLKGIDPDYPLRGIIHSSGVLSDGLLINSSPSDIRKVFAPKVSGAINLHAQTSDLDLEFFVMYSSVRSVMTEPGLGSYAASNSFLDHLTIHRHSQGLVATTVNWGLWEGGFSNQAIRKEALDQGYRQLNPKEAFIALERQIVQGVSLQVIADIDWSSAGNFHRASPLGSLISELERQGERKEDRSEKFLKSLENMGDRQRRQKLETMIKELVSPVLNLQVNEIDENIGLFEMGMSSLQAVELSNTVRRSMGIRLSPAKMVSLPNIKSMTSFIVDSISRQDQGPDKYQENLEALVENSASKFGKEFSVQHKKELSQQISNAIAAFMDSRNPETKSDTDQRQDLSALKQALLQKIKQN